MQRPAVYFKPRGRFPRQALQASSQLEGKVGEGTPHFPASKPVQGHAEREQLQDVSVCSLSQIRTARGKAKFPRLWVERGTV